MIVLGRTQESFRRPPVYEEVGKLEDDEDDFAEAYEAFLCHAPW